MDIYSYILSLLYFLKILINKFTKLQCVFNLEYFSECFSIILDSYTS